MEDDTESVASSAQPFYGQAKKEESNPVKQEADLANPESISETDKNEQNTPPDLFKKTWHQSYVLELSRLPGKLTDDEIYDLVSKFNPEACIYFEEDTQTKQREARISFVERKQAIKCCTFLHKKRVNSLAKLCKKPNSTGIQISAKILNLEKDLEKDEDLRKEAKKSRIIVRNLKFTVNETKLRNIFSHYGNITDIEIPKGNDGKKFGFAFVQFLSRLEAHKAINAFKGLDKKILGRVVAVDLALPKMQYLKEKNNQKEENESDDSSDDSDDSMEEDDQEDKQSEATEDGVESTDPETDEENLGDSDLEDQPDKPEKMEVTEEDGDVVEGKTLFIKNLPLDSNQSSLRKNLIKYGEIEFITLLKSNKHEKADLLSGSGFVKFKEKKSAEKLLKLSQTETIMYKGNELKLTLAVPKNQLKKLAKSAYEQANSNPNATEERSSSFDVHHNTTIFCRNLPYDASNQGLAAIFTNLGYSVNYAICLFDKETGTCKGTGFVQLTDKNQVEDILKKVGDDGASDSSFVYEGRSLNITLAVNRESAKNIDITKRNEKKNPEDKRRLYLVKEGQIAEDSVAMEGVSEQDKALRAKLLKILKTKLKNGEMFMSETRLVCHNVPKKLSDKNLQDLIYNTVKSGMAKSEGIRVKKLGKIKVTIMRDRKNSNKSLGYAFIQCDTHDIALTVLRTFNNNPTSFLKEKRPIVEFCCENRKAIQTQQRRREKFEKEKANSGAENKKSDESKNRKRSKPSENKSGESSIDNTRLFNFQGSQANKRQKGEKLLNLAKQKKKARWVKDAPSGRLDQNSEKSETQNDQPQKKREKKLGQKAPIGGENSRRNRRKSKKDDDFDNIVQKYMTKMQS